MSLKRFNESFKRLYESEIDAPQSQNPLKDELLAAADELINSGNYNIKAFEVAFQEVLEKNFPDSAWWEVCDLDIFGHLFTERDPFVTVDAIVDNLKVAPASDDDVNVEEALNEDNSFQYNGFTVVNNARDNCWFVKGGPQFPTDDEACEWIDQQSRDEQDSGVDDTKIIDEDMDSVYGGFCTQMDKEAEELYQRYSEGNQSPSDALIAMGYVEDPNNEHLYRKSTDQEGYELVFDFGSYDLDFDPFVTYYVLRNGKIPSGWTYSNISLDESMGAIMESLKQRLNESPMSDEDKHDSDLIRSILNKIQIRSNAALTPEEKAVIQKYGLHRSTDNRNLYPVDSEGRVRWQRPISHPSDGESRTVWSYNSGDRYETHNGTRSKINYADRARKAVEREQNATYGDSYPIDTISSNAHASRAYGGKKDYVKLAANKQAYQMQEPMDSMKRHLSDRHWAQRNIDGADSRRSAALSKAATEFEQARKRAEAAYEYDTVTSARQRDHAQRGIDKLLKRDPKEEGLKESKTFKINYDSNGKKSAVMVTGVASEEEARKLYTDKKGQKYPNINGVTELDDKAVADYTQKGMKTLN